MIDWDTAEKVATVIALIEGGGRIYKRLKPKIKKLCKSRRQRKRKRK